MKNWIIKIKKGICVFMSILRGNLDLLGFLIAFASLIIAFHALRSVTKVEGFKDLLKATYKMDSTLYKMDSTLFEQNKLQQVNIDRNESGFVELKAQTTTLIDIQKLNNAQLTIQRKVDSSNVIGDCKILEDLWEKLMYMRIGQENPFPIDKSFRKQTIKYLEDLNSLVSQGVQNNLLKRYITIYSQWSYFNSQIETTLYDLNFSEENVYTKYFQIPITMYELSPDSSVKPRIKDESDNIYQLEVLTKWTKRFSKNGVEPMMSIKEMQTYRHNNMTNYNKVTKE